MSVRAKVVAMRQKEWYRGCIVTRLFVSGDVRGDILCSSSDGHFLFFEEKNAQKSRKI
jgi:hypothetical protein